MNKPLSSLTASEINHRLDVLDREGSRLTTRFINEGRGTERPSETLAKSDPLALEYRRIYDERWALHNEIERRYGPGAPRRMPTKKRSTFRTRRRNVTEADLDAPLAGGPGVTVGTGGAYPSGTIRLTGKAATDMKRALGVCLEGACHYEAGHAGKCSDQ